jgi:hypothetical protein
MSTIKAILEVSPDGTLHLPVPTELRQGKVEVRATLIAANGSVPRHATPEIVQRRKEALRALRASGGLRSIIPDPAAWQREEREDRPLPGRE